MGEAVPGKRSTWYREAVVPGLKRSGRNPIFLVSNWMLPLEDFMADIAPREVYGNTWLALHANGEMFTDPALYPVYLRWTESARLPTVIEIMHHNLEAGFPFNSPRLASEIIRTYRRVENCRGYLAWFTQSDPNSLFRSALAYYSRNDAPYSDQPWIDRLEARFGDREAAAHFLRAYDASARIAPEVSALAWCPHDLSISRQLMLPYWYWTEQDPRWSEFASPARSGVLLPVRHYAAVVARMGPTFRDNSGTDYARNREHPGAQELIWGLGDYPVTPEAHMRNVQRLGETSMKEAEAALATVRRREDEARALADWMKAYQLLTEYYESKVLAAVSALVYSFNKAPEDRADAERLADEAVERYERAIQFLWEKIDKKTGRMKARWLGGQVFTLPQLIENERRERRQLGQLFHWPTDTS